MQRNSLNTSHKIVLGITGTHASGKDVLAVYLAKKYNLLHISSGDLVREEAIKSRGSIERPVLSEVATELRKNKGAGYLPELALKQFDDSNYAGCVVSGIRSIGELKVLREANGVIIFVDAPVNIRYKRAQDRRRDNESQISLEEFIAREEHEMYSGDSDGDFNIAGIKELSDFVIDNAGSAEQLFETAEQKLGFKA